MLTGGQGLQIRRFQRNNGAAFFYCVVGNIQVFAVYLYLLEVFISCIGSKGKTVRAVRLPCGICSGSDSRLEAAVNCTADGAFAVFVAVAGGRDLRIFKGDFVLALGVCKDCTAVFADAQYSSWPASVQVGSFLSTWIRSPWFSESVSP